MIQMAIFYDNPDIVRTQALGYVYSALQARPY